MVVVDEDHVVVDDVVVLLPHLLSRLPQTQTVRMVEVGATTAAMLFSLLL